MKKELITSLRDNSLQASKPISSCTRQKRWLDDVALWGNDYISQLKPAFSGIVPVDEKWIKINNSWWFLFAAVDCVTGYPLHVALLPANDTDYCKLFEQVRDDT